MLRFTRHDPHEIVGWDTKQGVLTRLDDSKAYSIIRTDIGMVNAPNGKQYMAYPRKDGTVEIEEGLKPFLTEEDMKWLESEAKLIAENWKPYPTLFNHLH